ncbi:hypothetical protein BJ742DRAFT_860603 [Cladochytrium replicatum]|nr:hypothetical protein BJ742DRAFT_860603 [Cladochytrium replicatum]
MRLLSIKRRLRVRAGWRVGGPCVSLSGFRVKTYHTEPPPVPLIVPLPFPSLRPAGFEQELPVQPHYAPSLHLVQNRSLPSHVTNLKFEQTAAGSPGFGFSPSFPVLSSKGLECIHSILCAAKAPQFAALWQSDDRTPLCARGLAYVSSFIRDLNACETLRRWVSTLAGEDLIPHSLPMNYSQINVGRPGVGAPIDAWHLDSVPYVLVVLLTPAPKSGGEFQAVRLNKDAAHNYLAARAASKRGTPDDNDMIESVKFPGAGWGILMRGEEVMHRVTAVRGPDVGERISMVLSYQPRVDRGTSNRLATYVADADAEWGFARHAAWRAVSMLDPILKGDCGIKGELARSELLERMAKVEKELKEAREVLEGKKDDAIVYGFDTLA